MAFGCSTGFGTWNIKTLKSKKDKSGPQTVRYDDAVYHIIIFMYYKKKPYAVWIGNRHFSLFWSVFVQSFL